MKTLKTRGNDYNAAYEQNFGYNPMSLKALEQGVTRPDAQQEEQFNSAWDQEHPYVAPTFPKGLSHPGGISTMALVNWYNEKTGQRYTAGGGGYVAEPGSGWRIVKPDSYDGQGKLVSQDPINMPGFVGPNYSAPSSPAAPSTPNPAPNYQTVGTTPTSPVYGATPPAPPTTPPSTTTTTPATPATPEPQPATPPPPPVLGATTPAPVNGAPQPVQPVPGMVAPSPQTPPPVLGATTPAPVNGTPQPVQVPTDNSYGITRTNAKAEGGPVAAPVGGFPGMKAMPTLSAPQNSQAAQAMMAAIPRMQESGPVSNTGYAPYTPTALPQRLAAVGVQPKVVPMSAEVAALKKQFPTATMDQLSEYNRAIADGGDPKATLSLMKAYSPASNYTSHQPWSPDFKGFDYKRSRPTDEFGNPVGWTPTAEDEASRQKSLAVSGGKAGYAPLDFPDQYRPDDEYIMNNPWTYGMDSLGGNVMPGEIGTRASERSSQGPTVVDANASYQEGKKAAADAAISKIESMYNPENIGALGPVDANQARMDAVTRAAQTQGMGAARSLGGDSLPGRQSSYFSTPDNFTLNNAIQTGFSALGVTPLAPLGYLANAFLTGTNAIPQAGDTGSRALNAIAQQGRMTDWGADAVNWGWRQLGGEAMPARATGGRAQACKEARKAIMIARAMGGRIGKADGGGIDDAAPIPTPVTSGPKTVFTSGGKQYEFAVTPPDKQITSKDLAAQTTDALQQHLSLPYMQQVANSKAAANKLAPYVGREKNGAVKPFLTMNAKLEKASAGYEAGPRYDAQAPLQLEGGVGVETIGMPLAPAYEHNKFKVCPNSAVCKDECLGVTSGNYAQADWWPRQNSKNRTHAFMSEPGALAVQLHNEIQNAKSAAAMRGNRLAVRLNVLSDIDPRVHETLIKANPDVDFYDYTKMNYDPIATETRNHHYTYSSTGLSQPAGVNGLTEGVENKHQNWKQMRQRLDTGSNVAMVFSHKEHLPREVYDRETDKTYRVVDGTTHDYRPLDKQAEGSNGVIIGLQNLNKTGKQDNAYKDSNGFVVHYDPQVQMVPNAKTGLPTKTPVKGPSPGVNKAGKSLPRPTFPTNYRVEIAPQGGEGRADGGAVNHGQQKIHPDYAAQQFHNYHIFNGPESAPLAKGERPAQYAYGGPVEGDRELDDSGFYNAAAEAAQGIPQAKGTPQQMMSMVQNAPGTQETMKWSGADQAFAGQPIVSKDDLVNHFQTNAPKLEETQLGLRSRTIEYDVAVLRYRNAIKQGAPKEEQDRLGAIANSFIDSPEPKYKKYTIPGGENYREILLKAPPNKSPERDRMSEIENRRADIQKELMKLNDDELYRHLSTEGTANVEDFTKEKIRLLSETENLKNEYKSLVPKTQNIDYNSSHWEGHPNVVAHLRMSDRTLPQTNEKALHLEEVQSDWGQDGKRGFKKTDEELRGLRDEMLALHKNYLDLHGSGAPPDQLQAAESKYNSAMNKFNNGFKAKTPEGPYVGNTNKWTDLALKRALIEAARGGHDKLIWTPGEEQALRYKEGDEENDAKRLKGMNKYYGEIVPSRLEKILQSIGHTPEFGTDYIKGKPYEADLDVYKHAVTGKYHVATGDKRANPDAEDMEAGPFNTHGEAVAHRDLLYKGLKAVPSLKITPAMRETISKGLPRKTGGFVPPARSSAVEQALKLTSKSGATLPAAVFLARQHQRRD
jgi:hypothetical protein